MPNDSFVGIDIGGTYTKLGLVSEGNVVLREIVKSPVNLNDFFSLFKKIKNDYKFKSVGMGIPGIIDHKKSIMRYASPSLSFLNDIPIKTEIEKIVDSKIYITNDANVVTIGEMIYGAGRGRDSAICLTLGTGIGGGVFYKNRLLIGNNGFAGEFGHINVIENGRLCSCGKRRGCIENYFSISGIIKSAKNIRRKELNIKEILALAEESDKDILKMLDNAAFLLGKSIGAILLVIDINTIILAGGLSRFYPFIKKGILRGITNYCYSSDYSGIILLQSELLENAGILGGAYLAETGKHILF